MKTQELIIFYREKKKMSLKTLGQYVGVSKQYLSTIETENRIPSNIKIIKRICKILEIPPEEMRRAIVNDFGIKLNSEWRFLQ
jgi:transcriptional regulator with XRE-family HTH domain